MVSTQRTPSPSGMNPTTESDEGNDGVTADWVYVLIEISYLVLFAIVTYLMRRFKFMKTEDDAVTKHHRHHLELVKKQQEVLIEKQGSAENFILATDGNDKDDK
ncbi:hypothetical protein CRE_08452 [Caenorhabditis remanei]|uniref:Uncharacterized protein n=1 Tax=Caenorhabditis remanei TaxID=31234 RepID=E3MZZ2_CAERE|nr:hypothetical protein CRE_08452 [Caenorhabditis remanei]